MTGNHGMDDERLRALFHDAVSDVEPHDGLGEVRRRTRVRRTSSRRWAPVLVGAGAVAATVVAATFVVNGLDDDPDRDDPPVASTSPSESTDDPTTAAAGLYFVGDTATGPRLFREFQAVTPTDDPEQKVLIALQRLTIGPRDQDYRTSGRRTRSAPSASRRTGSSSSSAPTRPRGRARRRRVRRAAGGLHRRSRAPRRAAGELRVGRTAGPAGARPGSRHRGRARHELRHHRSGQHHRSVRAAPRRRRHAERQRHHVDQHSSGRVVTAPRRTSVLVHGARESGRDRAVPTRGRPSTRPAGRPRRSTSAASHPADTSSRSRPSTSVRPPTQPVNSATRGPSTSADHPPPRGSKP